MSLKNKLFSILTVALGVVIFSAFTMAQDPPTPTPTPDKAAKRSKMDRTLGRDQMARKGFGGRHGMHGGAMRGLHGLNLTDTQKEQIRTIMQSSRPDQATITEVRTLGKAKRDGTITAEQQARLTALRTQSREKARSVHTQIEGVLTPEQKAQIETRKQQMRQRFDNGRQTRKPQPVPPATDKPATK